MCFSNSMNDGDFALRSLQTWSLCLVTMCFLGIDSFLAWLWVWVLFSNIYHPPLRKFKYHEWVKYHEWEKAGQLQPAPKYQRTCPVFKCINFQECERVFISRCVYSYAFFCELCTTKQNFVWDIFWRLIGFYGFAQRHLLGDTVTKSREVFSLSGD